MRNAAFGDQKGETTHDLQDVENSAAESNWSQLARAPNGREMTEVEGRNSHSRPVEVEGVSRPRAPCGTVIYFCGCWSGDVNLLCKMHLKLGKHTNCGVENSLVY